MQNDNSDSQTPPAVEEESVDEEFFVEIIRRSRLLVTLQEQPASASDLAELVELSRSTIHRAMSSLTDLKLVEKTEGKFRLTGYGNIVATEVDQFRKRAMAAQVLEPFLSHVDVPDLPIEHFRDATVIQPEAHQPHLSIRRIMELIKETDRLRVFSTVISPIYVEIAHREMLNGMEAEAIFDQQTLDIVLKEYEEETVEALESGNFDVFIHNSLPFELFLFDDMIGMAAHDEYGIARVLVVSSSDEAIAWAEELYSSYREESTPAMPISKDIEEP